jgi:hypothetical protein
MPVGAAGVPTNGVPVPSGLVSWWRGEETAADSVGEADGVLLDPDYQPGRFNYPFRGLIDELSVYSRALTRSEIQAIYSADSTGKSSSLLPRQRLMRRRQRMPAV